MARYLLCLLSLLSIGFCQQIYYCNQSTVVTIHSTYGIIASNPDGQNYADDMNCMWIIHPDIPVSSIYIEFDRFDTEYGYDVLALWDRVSLSGNPDIWYSGSELPTPWDSNSSAVTVFFGSDQLINAQGFQFRFYGNTCPGACSGNGACMNNTCYCNAGWTGSDCATAECPNDCNQQGRCINNQCVCELGYYGGDCLDPFCEGFTVYNASAGSFEDHNGAGEYRPGTDCQWLIQPSDFEVGDSIGITFPHFDTEKLYDFVTLYDGPTVNSPLLGVFSGSALPPPRIAKSGSILVTFDSDSGVQRTGFEANFALLKCNCSGHGFCGIGGTCVCDIGHVGDNCEQVDCPFRCWDHGQCHNGVCSCNSGYTGLDCGLCVSGTCPNVTVCTNQIQYLSDVNGTFADHTGLGDFEQDLRCRWMINQPVGTNIAVQFSYVDLIMDDTFITIYDGNQPVFSHIIVELSGSFNPAELPVYTSTSNQMLIVFESGNQTARGFSANYWTYTCENGCVNGDCILGTCNCYEGWEGMNCDTPVCVNNCSGQGECINRQCECFAGFYGPDCLSVYCDGLKTVTFSSGLIEDHSQGNLYLPSSNCSWLITPDVSVSSAPITIAFLKFQMEAYYDWVSVYEQHGNGSTFVIEETGSFIPDPVLVRSSSALIMFETDSIIEYTGFQAYYSSNANCPNQCHSQGYCIEETCACFAGLGGSSCDQVAPSSPLDLDNEIEYNLPNFNWVYTYIDIDENTPYQLTVEFYKTSNGGHPEFFIQKDELPSFGNHVASNYYWNNDNFLRVENPQAGRWYIGVYGRQNCTFTLKPDIVCYPSQTSVNHTCLCDDPCLTGMNCSEAKCRDLVCQAGLCVDPSVTTGGSPSPASSSSTSGAHHKGLSGGAVAAVIIVVLAIVGSVGGAVFFYIRRRRAANGGHVKDGYKFQMLSNDDEDEFNNQL